jgi:DNA repair photolyase
MPPLILSASRRTDLPGFHAEWLAVRLGRLRRRPDALFLWTKHPRALIDCAPLAAALAALPNVLVHLTVTGLGGGPIEPRVPPFAAAVAAAADLAVRLGGDGRRILWRFDPVIPGLSSLDRFDRIADRLARIGVERCVFSFPAARSLKGTLAPQYRRRGIPVPTGPERETWAARVAERARRHGMAPFLCGQPDLVEALGGAVPAASCIDAALAGRLHPGGIRFDDRRDPSQRRGCGCARSRDLGDYRLHPCGSGCGYCYSSAADSSTATPAPRDRAAARFGRTPVWSRGTRSPAS